MKWPAAVAAVLWATQVCAQSPPRNPPLAPPRPADPGPAAQAPVAPEGPVPPYEAQLLRLSELLGALAVLRGLCGQGDGDVFRARMAGLLDAEPIPARRARLAGAFNRGVRDYGLTYRSCTPNAQAIIARYVAEGGEITRAVAGRYGGS